MEKEQNLIVDDDKILCEHLKAGLSDEQYGLTTVNKAADAIDAIKKTTFNLVLMDMVLPDIQGSALMRTLSNYSPDTNFIVFTTTFRQLVEDLPDQLPAVPTRILEDDNSLVAAGM
jgi:DNA-binding NtrC family response regulator